MARTVLSGIFQDIRGSMGAVTFSVWKGIGYMRNKAVTITNPQTVAQMKVRASFAKSSAAWRTLTMEQQAMWEEYAQSTKGHAAYDEVIGDSGILPKRGRTQSGMNAFVGINQVLQGVNFPIVLVPPMGPEVGATSFILIIGTGAALHLEYTSTTNPEAKPRNLAVWLKLWHKASHPYISNIVAVPEPPTIPPPIDITTIRMGSGDNLKMIPFSSIIPCFVLVQGVIVRSDGRVSVSTALHRVKITA